VLVCFQAQLDSLRRQVGDDSFAQLTSNVDVETLDNLRELKIF
jgi:hypothetical protein